MGKKLLTFVAVSLMIVFAGTLPAEDNAGTSVAKTPETPQVAVAVASAPHAVGITIDTVVAAVDKAGIMGVKSIELDDGQWEVKTQDANTETKYVLQGAQLTQVGQEHEDAMLPAAGDFATLQAAIKAVQLKSYTVKGIEFEDNCWQVKAFDANGQEYEINVDKVGKIINSKMGD